MSIGSLSSADALTLLTNYSMRTTSYSPSGGETTSSGTANSKSALMAILKANPSAASALAAIQTDSHNPNPTASNFYFVGQTSGNSLTSTLVNNGLDKGTLGSYEQEGAANVVDLANSFVQENSMTSQQVSGALNSGQSIGPTVSDTFAGTIANMRYLASFWTDQASKMREWVAQGMPAQNTEGFDKAGFDNDTAAQVSNMATENDNQAASETALATALTTAFNNHTLTFQKATDVTGLDYKETDWASAKGGTVSASMSQSYNAAFMQQAADGKQHILGNIGGIELYMSW